MNVFLWIMQALLAAVFGLAGALKTTQPKEKLFAQMPWVADFSQPTVRFVGTMELLAALGLILPAATDIAPILTPLAASGIGVIMLLASRVHARRKEPQGLATNAVLFIVAVVIAWGRFGPYAF